MDNTKKYDILSFGAGVQSTTILLMACHGDIKKPDHIIFADTGWEPLEVYNHLDFCIEIAKKNNMKIEIVSNGNLKKDILFGKENGKRFASIPFFTLNSIPITSEKNEKDENQFELFDFEYEEKEIFKGYEYKKGMVRRQCTNEYKIRPIRKACRNFVGLKHGERAKNININLLMGISTDEIQRVKPSREKYITNKYPLIEKNFSRSDCFKYLVSKGHKIPPKSSCIGCPFRDDKTWSEMKKNDKNSWDDAIEVDEAIRNLPTFKGKAYLHKSCKPLIEVNFEDNQMEINDFLNECTGHCGV